MLNKLAVHLPTESCLMFRRKVSQKALHVEKKAIASTGEQ